MGIMTMKSLRANENTTAGRFRRARTAKGLTQQQLADRLGVTRGAVTAWERDDEPSAPEPSRLPDIVRELGVTADYLLGATGPGAFAATVPTVPVFDSTEVTQWGQGRTLKTTPEHRRVQTSTAYTYGSAVAMVVGGDSMAPVIPPGAIVVISREHTPTSGAIVVVETGRGAPMVRTLIDEGREPVLSPENARYPVEPLGASRIIGRVVEVIVRRSLL